MDRTEDRIKDDYGCRRLSHRRVKWLWYPFIPYGKLTIIQGDPGDGKTTLVLNHSSQVI